MKKSRKQAEQPESALQLVSSLVEELTRLKEQCAEVGRELSQEQSPSARLQLQKLRQQYTTNLARLIKPAMAAEERKGLLVMKSDVDAVWSRTITEMRSTLEQIPRRVATDPLFAALDPVDVANIIQHEVNVALAQLSNEPVPKRPAPYTGPSSGRKG